MQQRQRILLEAELQSRLEDDGGSADPLLGRVLDVLKSLPAEEPPPRDNTMRNVLLKEAAHQFRTDNERATAKKQMNDDDAIIRSLLRAGYNKIAHLISMTARFAGELQHNLINPHLRYNWKSAVTDVERDGIVSGCTNWREIVDPGLVGNTSIACRNISAAYPHTLHNLQVEHILECEDARALEYFCAVTAARWRANTVFAAGPYKTGKEQNAVVQALNESIALFKYFVIKNGRLLEETIQSTPETLSELRKLPGSQRYSLYY